MPPECEYECTHSGGVRMAWAEKRWFLLPILAHLNRADGAIAS